MVYASAASGRHQRLTVPLSQTRSPPHGMNRNARLIGCGPARRHDDAAARSPDGKLVAAIDTKGEIAAGAYIRTAHTADACRSEISAAQQCFHRQLRFSVMMTVSLDRERVLSPSDTIAAWHF